MQKHFAGSCGLVTALDSHSNEITARDKLRFSGKVISKQLFSYDLLFFDHLGLARVQTLLPASLARPYGVFLHAIEAWGQLDSSGLRALTEAKVRVAPSGFSAERIAAAHPEADEIDVCHLALGRKPEAPRGNFDAAVIDHIHRESILIVGRIMKGEAYKGHDQLISAWPLVRQQVPAAQLVIVGRGDDIGRLKSLAQQLGVGDAVLFLGPVDEATLHAIYEHVAAFAMPSRAEGFGVVYLEAMSHRLPCIGSIHDGAREIIVDGETGFLVHQDDTDALAAKITLLLTDSALRQRMSANSFERWRNCFSFEQFERRMLQVFQKLGA